MPSLSFAFDYERSPAGSEVTNPISITFSSTDLEGEFWPGQGQPLWVGVAVWNGSFEEQIGVCQLVTGINTFSGTFTGNLTTGTNVRSVDPFGSLTEENCNDVGINNSITDQYSGYALEFDGNNTIFSVAENIVTTNNTWHSQNGFWGSTTPISILGGMTASVQSTGASIWPLFKYVGIPLAFAIALHLINFIYNSVVERKKRKNEITILNPNGEDFITHSAEDLEFKREYGQETRRKRGRPRKNTI